jgi:hypothetical protein
MKLQIRESDWLDDWYVLCDEYGRDVGGASVEGTLEEWVQIAHAMKKRESCSHKRCSARWMGHYYSFSSPRNSMGEEACAIGDEIDQLADSILAQIGSGAGI